MERRLEEIKDGKEPTNLMMSEETLTAVSNLKVEKVARVSIHQREKQLVKQDIIKYLKKKGLNS